MKNRDNNFLDMVLSVKTVMDDNRALWASKKPVRESYEFTTGNASRLEALRVFQRTGRDGVALNKTDIGNLMVEEAVEMAGQLCAYAAKVGDKELMTFADLEPTHFHALPDTEMDDLALAVHDKAKALFDAHTATPPANGVENFTDYDVNSEKLMALAGLARAYAAVVHSPRAATVAISTATDTVEDIVAQQREHFDMVFDKLMKPFKKSAPEFFAKYEKARVIMERGGGKEKVAPAQKLQTTLNTPAPIKAAVGEAAVNVQPVT